MKLYESPVSANSRKVRAVAAELGLSLERVPLALWAGEHRRPNFLSLNPNGKVPVLVDGDFVLWESHAILSYLASRYGGGRLLPEDSRGRAEVERWLYWVSSHLDPALGAVVFQKLVKPTLGWGQPDEVVVSRAMEETHRCLSVLESWLRGNSAGTPRTFLAGPLSVADFALAAHLAVREVVGLDLTRYERVAKWLARIESRPAWKSSEADPPNAPADTRNTR